jgi:hypothetical protein
VSVLVGHRGTPSFHPFYMRIWLKSTILSSLGATPMTQEKSLKFSRFPLCLSNESWDPHQILLYFFLNQNRPRAQKEVLERCCFLKSTQVCWLTLVLNPIGTT